MVGSCVTGLHGKNDLLCFAPDLFIVKIDPAVDSFIATFLLLNWSRADETKCPPLELIGILLRQFLSIRQRDRFTNDFEFNAIAERIIKPMFYKCDCKMRNINADPLSF